METFIMATIFDFRSALARREWLAQSQAWRDLAIAVDDSVDEAHDAGVPWRDIRTALRKAIHRVDLLRDLELDSALKLAELGDDAP
jgi:hypothetical protein